MDTDEKIRRLGEPFFELDEDGRPIALAIYQGLSAGVRPTIAELSTRTGLDEATVRDKVKAARHKIRYKWGDGFRPAIVA